MWKENQRGAKKRRRLVRGGEERGGVSWEGTSVITVNKE